MVQWEFILKDLADDPSEFDRQGGTVLLIRQGKEVMMSLKDVPGVGLAVEQDDQNQELVPIAQYIQNRILELPRLGTQIIKVLDRLAKLRPAPYVDGPAELVTDPKSEYWTETKRNLIDFLVTSEAGTTRLIQLMGVAGQGKTVLLEEVARETALRYKPDPYPTPLVLPIDLLGRYVGTVDDAIAGSLNNTYLFTGLTQRDVALCIRQRWMILALDGFDELVARVGARDAFLRITELVDQLNASGTVILSARESFFELHQITAAIRSYLQPKLGTYSNYVIRLQSWTEREGERVFQLLGSPDPQNDLNQLLEVFTEDKQIVLQPFFLTRLADLWKKGERFPDAVGKKGTLYRTRFIIEKFIARESQEKWIDREGRPLLTEHDHTVLLSGIAEEMWRSGAFRLSAEELRIAGQLSLHSLRMPIIQVDAVIERLPTHAALAGRDRGYSFVHDRFLHYYLGVKLEQLILNRNRESFAAILGARELTPEIIEWVEWLLEQNAGNSANYVEFLLDRCKSITDQTVQDNLASLIGRLISKTKGIVVDWPLTFVGDVFARRKYEEHEFVDCQFWYFDIRGSQFENVKFTRSKFGDVLLDEYTSFSGSTFSNCEISSIEVSGSDTYYAPDDIADTLRSLGADISNTDEIKVEKPWITVESDAIKCVHRLVRMSEITCDVAIEELELQHPNKANLIKRLVLTMKFLRK
ncbi:MAG: NACHT domain-containing protein [Acidobacteriota bacterium]|nr:MAG: NACHT domain-containing protein [Acidobacteriota bacterium]